MNRKISRRTMLGAMGATSVAAMGASSPTLAWALNRMVAAAGDDRPNIVVLMTDDQDVASMSVMANVKTLLADRGTTFVNGYAPYPLCGPSRSSYLTGQYPHNHGVWSNTAYSVLDHSQTMPVWLSAAGYNTAHIGKYLNGYSGNEIPPGWTEWYGGVDPSTYQMWGYTLNQNGSLKTYGQQDVEDPTLYQTDVYSGLATDFIARRAPENSPFFLSVCFLAPHWEYGAAHQTIAPRPAPRHKGRFASEPLPKTPSFNEEDVSDKPEQIRNMPLLTDTDIDQITTTHRARLESLLAVDEAVAAIVNALEAAGEVDRTLVVFASDHGYLQGQHRIPAEKFHPYEESAGLPLILRGPGIPAGAQAGTLISNIDLAPTFLEIGKAQAGITVDGRSLIPFATGPDQQRDLLIETNKYEAIRSSDGYLYVEHSTGEVELYDLNKDRDELQSLHSDPAYSGQLADLAARLHTLQKCSGAACST